MVESKNLNEKVIAATAIIAVIISIISLLFTYYSDTLQPGEIITLQPVGFGIIRDIPDTWSQSDGIILPIEWYNSWGKKTGIIRMPYIILRELRSNEAHRFELLGEYADLSGSSLDKSWTVKQTFVILPKDFSEHILIFKINNSYTPMNKNIFRFGDLGNYSLSIGYQEFINGEFQASNEMHLINITLPSTVNKSTEWKDNRYRWIYFDLVGQNKINLR